MATSPPSTLSSPLNILIVGAGVCGPTMALLLQRSNPKHHITVIERWASLRTGGQQIDLKDQGVPILQRLGLDDELRKLCIHEGGMEIVDDKGNSVIQTGIRKVGEKEKAFQITNEFEFMRGDFVHMMYKTSLQERQILDSQDPKKGSLKYHFNTTITALDENTSTSATVTLSTGETKTYDLIIAADGQGSRTRRLAFGEETSKLAFHSLHIHAAFYNIPRLPHETSLANIYLGPNNSMVLTRRGSRPLSQIYLFQMKNPTRTPLLSASHTRPVPAQKAAWQMAFKDAGGPCDRYIAELASTPDFYATEIAQVKMPHGKLTKGRVVLLGDAAYCPSVFTGKGTTLALIGAYVLAGELARSPNDVCAALAAYEVVVREPVREAQSVSGWLRDGGAMFPQSKFGVKVVYWGLWVFAVLRLHVLVAGLGWFVPARKLQTWEVPEYPGMNLKAPEAK